MGDKPVVTTHNFWFILFFNKAILNRIQLLTKQFYVHILNEQNAFKYTFSVNKTTKKELLLNVGRVIEIENVSHIVILKH